MEMTPRRSRPLAAFALLAIGACRSDEVGPITLAEPPADSPVRATEVKARLSRMVGVRAAPRSITEAAARDGKNTAAAIFQVHVEQAPPAGLQMASTSTCRVGEWTIAQPLTWIGDIAGTPVGENRELYAQYMPTGAAMHEPTACEFSLFYGSPGMRDAPRIEPVRLTTVCWTKDSLVEDACPSDALPRTATEGGGAITIPVVLGGTQPAAGGKGHFIGYEYLVTANAAVADRTRIVGRMQCHVGGELVSGSGNTVTMIDHLAVGESVAGHGQAFSDHPLAAPPEWCTLDLDSQVGDPTSPRSIIATWCLRDGKAEQGACE